MNIWFRGYIMERGYDRVCAGTAVFLITVFFVLGGIPTDILDIIIIFSCVYFPILFPFLISIIAIGNAETLKNIEKTRGYIKLSMIYNLTAVPAIWWIVGMRDFELALYTLSIIAGVEFGSLIAHGDLWYSVNDKYKELKDEYKGNILDPNTVERGDKYKEIKILWILILSIFAVVLVYRSCIKFIIIKSLDKEPPIIFSAYFSGNDYSNGYGGTFTYDLASRETIKISDYIFYSPSYNDDRTKIIGVIDEEGGFKGIGELDLRDRSFKEVLDLAELNEFSKDNGQDTFDLSEDYLYVSDRIRGAKYYKDSYTFVYDENICMLSDTEGSKKIRIIRNADSKARVETYHINENDENILYVETVSYEDGIDKHKVTVENMRDQSSEILAKRNSKNYEKEELDGIMEVSDDVKQLIYRKSAYIYFYDLESGLRKNITRHKSLTKDILDFKLSEDKQYLFYTSVQEDTWHLSDYTYTFCVVHLKSGAKTCLRKWKSKDCFYGFAW